jgi:putative two-component system response regulator
MSAVEATGRQILIVDDNTYVASLLQTGLSAEGYQIRVASDGFTALKLIAQSLPDLILLDLEMPGLNGDEVCRRLKSSPTTHLIPVVMITAQSDLRNRLDAWEYGADEFLGKPFHMVEVLARCRSLLRIKGLVEERDSAESVVFALARAVEAKSPYTHGHSERVQTYSLLLADALSRSAREREVLCKGALLHDVGKISIPDAILDKPSSLTRAEYDLVKEHAAAGARIVEPLRSVRDAVPLIRWHHERLDGTGYPDRLKGDEIPLLVRILSVADVYDSLSSERPYRSALPHAACIEIMRDNALNGGLDLELVTLFDQTYTPTVMPPAPLQEII